MNGNNCDKLVLKVKKIDLEAGGTYVVVLNKKLAEKSGIKSTDRALIKKGRKAHVGAINITSSGVLEDEIGVFNEWQEVELRNGEKIEVNIVGKPSALEAVRKKIFGEKLTKTEIYDIIHDITFNEMTQVEIAGFVVAVHIRGMDLVETANLTKAMVEYGQVLKLSGTVVNKHCIGGVAGNRTTPIVVSIIAESGLKIPKTSSRSITSPAGTADTVEFFADVSFNVKDLKKIIDKTNGCMVWGGSLDLAPADDKIIKVEKQLSIDPENQMLASVMAKISAVSAKYAVIDIPVGKEAKINDLKDANRLKEKFIGLGQLLGIKTSVLITDAKQPIGNGVGPALETRDVLYVLMNDKRRPLDLEEKALRLAGELLEITGKAKDGYGLAKKILDSGRAYKKFKEIIKAQRGNPEIMPDDIKTGNISFEFKSNKSGKITKLNNKIIVDLCKRLGNPIDKRAGIYLHKKIGDEVKSGELLMTLYAEIERKLERTKEILKDKKNNPYSII